MKESGKWLAPPKGAEHPQWISNYPGNLYNSMIHPLVPYGIRGAIWYQGESNTNKSDGMTSYGDLLKNMIAQWRKAWKDDFAFYAVQLPGFATPAMHDGLAIVRDGVLRFQKEAPNTGMAITIDVGDEKDIHPKNKKPVGERLARLALAKTCGRDIVPGGPIYRNSKADGGKMVIRFNDVGSGLMAKGGEPLNWFYIAGQDKEFHEAQARIVGDTVEASSPEVSSPVAVRYAWANYPGSCKLFNNEGLPASPFRTGDWPLEE